MLRSLLVLVFAVGHFITPQLPKFVGFGIPLDKAVNTGVPPPEQPSGATFAIWALIFTLSLIFALAQLRASRRDTVVYQAIGWPAAFAFLGNNLWMGLAQFVGNGPALVASIWFIWICAAIAFFRLLAMRARLDRFDSIVTLPLFAMLTAWISAAAVLNTGSWLRLAKLMPPTLTPTLQAAVMLLVIAALSLLLLRRANGYLMFGITTLWALGGVAHANIWGRPNQQVAGLAIGLALLVVAMLLWQRRPGHKDVM